MDVSRSCWCSGELIAFCWLCVLMFSCACECVSFDYTSRPWEYLPVWSPHVSLKGKPCVTNTHFRVELIVSFLTWICAHPHFIPSPSFSFSPEPLNEFRLDRAPHPTRSGRIFNAGASFIPRILCLSFSRTNKISHNALAFLIVFDNN